MKIITIGGLPCAGKTFTSKLLAKELNCLAIEVESLRWCFFDENPQLNMFSYTNNEPIRENESLRSYYLRCTLYERKMNLDMLIKWHKKTTSFIDGKMSDIFNKIQSIKTQKDYEIFCSKYKNVINYKPKFSNLNMHLVVISHAFINTMNFSKQSYLKFDFDSDYSVLINRFKERENIANNYDQELKDYYRSYSEILENSNALKLDTTKDNVFEYIRKLL